ncbi:ankyrin [Anaeromyces robustus]|uniref:Ankyrin n=1 Tax=Anaeromyces robustus TaxID=1754192 RepID=A0A1Y1WYN6_9FUNG|nr:ankyrin [Anaeromyces robustus]|eukprot:ORX78660.1 ankyrin [Anaeromyces robustus]
MDRIIYKFNNDFEEYDSSYYLFNACKSGNKIKVKYLLEHGADMTIIDKFNRIALVRVYDKGDSPICSACQSGNLNKYCQIFSRAGIKNSYGETPLFIACENGHFSVVKYLVEQEAKINKRG